MREMRHILFLALAVFTLAACTQDDISSPSGGVEGAPLTLTATIAGGVDTRATVDGDWEIGDEVALWVQTKGVFHYEVTDDTYGTMTGDYYWQDSDNGIYIYKQSILIKPLKD